MRHLLFVAITLACNMCAAQSSLPDSTGLVTDNDVTALIENGGSLYAAGEFEYIGTATGNALLVNQTTGAVTSGFPRVEGTILTVLPDGSGGWYLGGSFTHVGSLPRLGLAHVTAALTVNPTFVADVTGTVRALELAGGDLYLGGTFTEVQAQARANLAAVNVTTGAVQAWNPGTDGTVNALDTNGSVIFMGGAFNKIAGASRVYAGAVDTGGMLTGWQPPFGYSGEVKDILLDGPIVYLAGSFTRMSGFDDKNRLLAVDSVTGTPSPRLSRLGFNSTVNTIVKDNNRIYFGGSFSRANVSASNVAKFDTQGVPDATYPDTNGAVNVAISDGAGGWYIAGNFTTVGGLTRNRVARIDSFGFVDTNFVANINDEVKAMALGSGGLYLGHLNFISRLDATTGTPASGFNLTAFGGTVNALHVDATALYVGGGFSTLTDSSGNFNQRGVVDVDPLTGDRIQSFAGVTSGVVLALAGNATQLFVGGNYGSIAGVVRSGMAEIDKTTGIVSAWDPSPDNNVTTLQIDGSELVIGGSFNAISGQAASRLALYTLPSMTRISFGLSINQAITHSHKDGNVLYLVGQFTNINNTSVSRTAKIDLTTGAVLPWEAVASNNSSFTCIATDGTSVIIGCKDQWFGSAHKHVVAVDLTTDSFEPWDPGIVGGTVETIVVSGSSVYFGGRFHEVGAQPRRNFATCDAVSGNVGPQFLTFSHSILVMVPMGPDVLCAGSFSSAGGVLREHLAEIDLATNTVTAWNPQGVPSSVNDLAISGGAIYYGSYKGTGAVNLTTGIDLAYELAVSGEVHSLTMDGSTVWVGGSFTHIGSHQRLGRAIYDGVSRTVTAGYPSLRQVNCSIPDGTGGWYTGGTRGVYRVDSNGVIDVNFSFPAAGAINSMRIDGNTLFVAGEFWNIGGAMRTHLAAIDVPSATVLAWDPAPDQEVYEIEVLTGRLFVCGKFDVIGGSSRDELASFDISTLQLNSWQPVLSSGDVTSLATDGSSLFAGGWFSSLGGSGTRLAQFDPFSDTASSWTPNPSDNIYELAVNSGKLYVGGDFTTISGVNRSKIARYSLPSLTLDSWAPTADVGPFAFAFSGSSVIVGGAFSQINSQPVSHIAELDSSSGALGQAWPQPDDKVGSLMFSGTQLLVGGEFNNVLGESRPYLASFNQSTRAATGWAPNPDNAVYAVSVEGGFLYCGGAFKALSGQVRHGAGCYSVATGSLTTWAPNVDGTVRDLHVTPDSVLLAGSFKAVNSNSSQNLASVDKVTGALAGKLPGLDSTVLDVWSSGGVVFASGLFRNAGDSANQFQSLHPTTGVLTGSQPQSIDGPVLCMVEDGTGGWYIGGEFTKCNGLPRQGLARIHSNGVIDTAFDAKLDGVVRALVQDGNTLYVGGDFQNAGTYQREHFAAIELQSGANYGKPTALRLTFNNSIRAMLLSGSLLYTGGDFSDIDTVAYGKVARIDLTLGQVDATFNPSVVGTVRTMAVNSNLIMVGGTFSTVDGQPRGNLAAWETSGLALSAWNPLADASVQMLYTRGLNVYAGGSFTQVGGQLRSNVAELDANTASGTFAQALAYNPDLDGPVNSITTFGSLVYLGGAFENAGALRRLGVVATDFSGNVQSFDNPVSGVVWSIGASSGAVFVGGDLELSHPVQRNRAACIAGGTLTSWQPQFSQNPIDSILVAGGKVYAGGGFQSVGQFRIPYFAQFDCPPLIGSTAILPAAVVGSNYSYFLTAAGGQPAYTWSTVSRPTWLSLNTTTGELSGTVPAISPATQSFDAIVTDQLSVTDQVRITIDIVSSAALAISTPAQLANQHEGFPIVGSFLQSTGGFGTIQWSLTIAPAWLSINASSGQLLGTPPVGTAPSTVNFTAEVTDSLSQSDSKSFQFFVPIVTALSITTVSPLPTVFEGSSVNVQLTATGGVLPLSWSLQNHPAWLSIDANTGLLSGVPPVGTGTTNILFDVIVVDARPASKTGNFTQPVFAIPQPSISTSTLPDGSVGVSWQSQIAATGGTPPYNYELVSGPDWISVNGTTGEISGVPSWGGLGIFDVIVLVRDSFSTPQEGSRTLALLIQEAPCTPGIEGWETNKPSLSTPVGAPSRRSEHSVIWTGSKMIVWGGSYISALNNGGSYDPTTDTWDTAPNLTNGTGAPSPRSEHTAVWTGKYMIVWGGLHGGSYYDTGGVYEPATDTWLATPNLTNGTGAPSGRRESRAVWTGRYMIVWGGRINAGGSNKPNTGGVYDPATDTWLNTPNLSTGVGAPNGRVDHSLIWTGRRMLVWGGTSGAWGYDGGGLYDPATDTWSQPPGISTAVPSYVTGRYGHSAVWTGSSMIVWGGKRGYSSPSLRSGLVYDPVADIWAQPTGLNNAAVAPMARQEHVAVYGCGRMIVWGGNDENSALVSFGGVYDTATDQWSSAPGIQTGVGSPNLRRYPRAVWTGSRMLVWGGEEPAGNGGSYVPPGSTTPSTPTVTVTASDSQAQEEPTPTNLAIFTVQLSPGPVSSVSIDFQIGGSASNTPSVDFNITGPGVSWNGATGSILVPPFTTSIDITITPVDDSLPEGTEDIQFQLTASSNYIVGSSGLATVDLLDDDAPSPPTNGGGGSDDDGGGCTSSSGSEMWWIVLSALLVAVVSSRRRNRHRI
ncbi:putative Ig domain-containing protein [Planctomycetota bacterium]|nr:putative Ig domain-containing protein [Planctomycetota bacterium]